MDSFVLIGVTDPVAADVVGAKEGRSVGCIARTHRAVRGREANTTVALGHSARATRRQNAPSVSAACRQSRRRGRRTVRHRRLDAPYPTRKPKTGFDPAKPPRPKIEATLISPSTHPTRLRLQRFSDGFGVLGSDPQQGTRWTFRGTSPLLPVLEGGNTHTDQEGEFRLRLAEALSDSLDVVRRNSVTRLGFISPRRMAPACRMLATN